MFAFLKRSIVIIVGFLLIAAFIWFAGPYFAFADYRPLDPPMARLILTIKLPSPETSNFSGSR